MTGCHTKGPPTIEGLTALHYHHIDQVTWQRLVVGRQQKGVQAEEHIVVHHSEVIKHTHNLHLMIAENSNEGEE